MKSKKHQLKPSAVLPVETLGGNYYLLESTFEPRKKAIPAAQRKKDEGQLGKSGRKRK